MSELSIKKGRLRFRGKAMKNLTEEERLDLVDTLIDRDAAMWKQAVRENKSILYDFLSRAGSPAILYPKQR